MTKILLAWGGIFLLSFSLTGAGQNFSQTNNEVLLEMITGKTEVLNYYPRTKAIQHLNPALTEHELEIIYSFLQCKTLPDSLKVLEFNSLKNDLVCVMLQHNQVTARLVDELSSMYGDAEYGEVWRDYCIQFLGRCIPMATKEENEKIISTLKKAAESREYGIAASALLALSHNMGNDMVDKDFLKTSAYNIVTNSAAPAYAKITALQIGGVTDDIRFVKISRTIVKDDSARIQLKMSALALLGKLGSDADIPIFETYRLSSDIRLRTAATSALKVLQRKYNNTKI